MTDNMRGKERSENIKRIYREEYIEDCIDLCTWTIRMKLNIKNKRKERVCVRG